MCINVIRTRHPLQNIHNICFLILKFFISQYLADFQISEVYPHI